MRRLRSIIGGITTNTALFAALQVQTGGTPLTLAATTIPATAGQIYLTAAPVTLTSAGNLSAGTFTVIGTDRRGNALSEVITGPNANTVSGHFLFATITSITPNTTSATTVSAGVANIHYGPWLTTAFHLSTVFARAIQGAQIFDVYATSFNFLDPTQFNADPVINAWGQGSGLIVPQPGLQDANGAFPFMPASLQTAAPWLMGTNLVLPEDDGTWSQHQVAPTTFTSAAPGTGGTNTAGEIRLDPTGAFAWRLVCTANVGLAQMDVSVVRPALS